MSWVFDGLPLHPLIVHAPVVLIPLVAAGLMLFALRPATRGVLGPVLVVLAMGAAFTAVLAVASGERLAEDLGRGATASTHAARGELTRLLAIVVVAATVGLVALDRFRPDTRAATSKLPGLFVSWMAIVATIVVGLTGHSGAQLAWEGKLPSSTGGPAGTVVAATDSTIDAATSSPTPATGGGATAGATAGAAEPVVEVILGEWTLLTSVDEIPPGPTMFRIRNAGTQTHAFRIRTLGSGGDRSEWRSESVAPGETIMFMADLPAGTLELTCPIEDGAGDHGDLGMEGPLTVREDAPPPVPATQPPATAPQPGSTPGASAASNVMVDIRAFAYAPDPVTVSVGGSVTWTNGDPAPHTATGDSFDSGTLSTGETASVTFAAPGEFAYFCSIHPSMTGRIIVAE